MAIIIFILLNISPAFFLQVYGQGDAFINDAIPVVRVVSSALIIMSFSTIWLNAVLGTGNSTICLAIDILAIICYVIYVYLVLEYYNLSVAVGWMSEWIYWTTIFIPAYLYMRSGKWKHKVI